MKAEQLELFRRAILNVLSANPTRHGLPVEAIRLHLGMFAFPNAKTDEIMDQLDYFERRDPPLAEQALKVISKENLQWRITREGRAFLDS